MHKKNLIFRILLNFFAMYLAHLPLFGASLRSDRKEVAEFIGHVAIINIFRVNEAEKRLKFFSQPYDSEHVLKKISLSKYSAGERSVISYIDYRIDQKKASKNNLILEYVCDALRNIKDNLANGESLSQYSFDPYAFSGVYQNGTLTVLREFPIISLYFAIVMSAHLRTKNYNDKQIDEFLSIIYHDASKLSFTGNEEAPSKICDDIEIFKLFNLVKNCTGKNSEECKKHLANVQLGVLKGLGYDHSLEKNEIGAEAADKLLMGLRNGFCRLRSKAGCPDKQKTQQVNAAFRAVRTMELDTWMEKLTCHLSCFSKKHNTLFYTMFILFPLHQEGVKRTFNQEEVTPALLENGVRALINFTSQLNELSNKFDDIQALLVPPIPQLFIDFIN